MRKFRLSILLIGMLGSVFIPLLKTSTASALSGSDFNPGRIIDDVIFYNKDSMTVQQIQDFLNAKVPVCDTNHVGFVGSSGTRYDPPFTCLKQYQENPTTHENNISRPSYQVPGGQSAAQIIWQASQDYNINPQVILVTLQKESGIVTDDWAASWQYKTAMGYGCPDTAACDTKYYGFYNQVTSAAWQWRRYATYPDQYNFKAGVTRYIQYSPNSSCGGTNIFLVNQATANLYNYTPYQPNGASLAVMNDSTAGGSVNCGAYGNRNFFWYFNKWFGSTNKSYSELISSNYPNSYCKYLVKNQYSNSNYCSSPMSGDFNGDGFEDVAMFYIQPDAKSVNLWIFPGSATGVNNPIFQQSLDVKNYWDLSLTRYFVSDINGDGKSDIIMFQGDTVDRFTTVEMRGSSAYLSSPPSYRWDLMFGPGQGLSLSKIQPIIYGADFNGDGYGDISFTVTSSDGKSFDLWEMDGSLNGLVQPKWMQAFPVSKYWNINNTKFVTANSNGDSYGDVILFVGDANDKTLTVEVRGSANGLLATPILRWDRFYTAPAGLAWSTIQPVRNGGKISGTAYDDIALFTIYPGDKKAFNLWVMSGSSSGIGNPTYQQSFNTNQYWNISKTYTLLLDYNGDKKKDLLLLPGDANNDFVLTQIQNLNNNLLPAPNFRWDRWYKSSSPEAWSWKSIL